MNVFTFVQKHIQMKIVFDGHSSQIDANTLINVLIHSQTVISAANMEYGGGSKSIHLKVNAIEKGSFIVDISLVESLKDIFTRENVAYIAGLTAIIDGIYQMYKQLKGKPAKTEEDQTKIEIHNTKVKVEIKNIVNVYNQPIVREAISKSIETAESDTGVEGFNIDIGEGNTVRFDRKDFKSYIYDDFDKEKEIPGERSEIVEAVLVIVSLSFESGSRWQFLYNGFKIPIIVKDDALMARIDNGDRFGKGDCIRVKMKIVQRYNPTYKAYENTSYKIVEFIEHIEAIKQDKLI